MNRTICLAALFLLPLCGTPALADCAPNAPADGGVVNCTGTDSNGFSSSAIGITVNVDVGATVANSASDGIRVRGDNATVTNNGTISGTGPLPPPLPGAPTDGIDGGNGLTVTNTGIITATSRGIDADQKNDVTVINTGSITAQNKAIRNQNGLNGKLTNSGTIRSETNEGYETGDNAVIINSGTIEAQDDAVQFGQNGKITNSGTIRSFKNLTPLAEQQDAIDLDSGEVINEATGLIISEANAGIDFDGSTITSTITNRGRIAGTTGILVDKGEDDPTNENTAAQIIYNYGIIEGSDGLAIDVGAGDDALSLFGGSTLIGGIDMGTGEDALNLFDDLAGKIAGGKVLDGGAGIDLVDFRNLTIGNVLRAWGNAKVFKMILTTPSSSYSVALANWEGYKFGDTVYDRSQISAVAPVPLPAAGLLTLAGLGGLAALRRRRR